MKLTNKYGLPETIVNVVKRPTYSKGEAHLSATELLTSPRIVQLRSLNMDNIEQDVSDMVWSIFGTAIHGVLEHGKAENHIVEERLRAEIDGWTISGAIDLQEVDANGIMISDYKTTGAWSVMNEKSDWVNQLNIYAWLVEKVKKVPVKGIQIVAIIRDWSRRDAANKEGYPQAPIVTITLPLWSFEDREAFIRERIHLHSEAHFAVVSNGNLPYCTPSDMWEKPSVWAVKKKKNIRAAYLFNDEESAKNRLQELGDEYAIEHRPGERTRCENFCQVRDFCLQWAEYREKRDGNQ